jgi:hypothetical protein
LKKLANEFADKFTGFGSYIGDLPDDDLELNALIAFLGDREPHWGNHEYAPLRAFVEGALDGLFPNYERWFQNYTSAWVGVDETDENET